MRQRRLFLILAGALFLIAARQHPSRPAPFQPVEIPADIFSYAEPEDVSIRHVALDLTVDFQSRQLRGSATLNIVNHTGTRRLILDTRDLQIESVTIDNRPATWELGPTGPLGSSMTIPIEPASSAVRIAYTTSPSANALHWMSAAQSYGRQRPYLYSQNEPDMARSWIPIQDTPAARMTYEATLRVPPDLLALMSAENPTERRSDGVYTFHMRQPIPAYLIAVAVGRLEFRPLDDRSGIYGEPELLDDAVSELHYIPAMIDAAERIVGPYPWGRYDILLMPPTYIVGGMEHPRLNFINPFSAVTGNGPDRAPVSSLIAHELAHSWAGDLVTCGTWSDLWLNEGITSYLTLRILEEVDGEERAEHGFFLDRRGYAEYAKVADPRFTVLHRSFASTDRVSSIFSSTAYTKGELFMKTLEDLTGREEFDRFLRRYFDRYAYRSIDELAFLRLFRDTVVAERPSLEGVLQLDTWIYGSGLPANVTAPESSRIYDRVAAEASAFRTGKSVSALNTSGWNDLELGLFLSLIPISVQRMAELDAAFGLTMRASPPGAWLSAVARNGYSPGMVAVERILMRGGHNSTVASLYSELSRTAAGKEFALSVYSRARDRYDPSIQAYVDDLLGLAGGSARLAPAA